MQEIYVEGLFEMSEKLLGIAKKFIREDTSAEEFVDKFQTLWDQERDPNLLEMEPPQINEALSSIFCVADLFNGDDDKESYEIDEKELKRRVKELLDNC